MNKISGYKSFDLADGRTIELAFTNGTFEIYGRAMGFKTFNEANQSLVAEKDEKGENIITFALEEAYRQFVWAAVKFVAMRTNQPDPFKNEWEVSDFIEEIGLNEILGGVENVPEKAEEEVEEPKKKGKAKVTQS
ncbi:MAG: hypothetical protein EOO39_18855 [Cytophagaceae bacterium]|nr:MAG: hypothetical protein EOO39_18855 [Cytophagaceae bacterium]